MPKEITVTFTEQQVELLDKLKEEEQFGSEHSQIVLSILRAFMKSRFFDEEDNDPVR